MRLMLNACLETLSDRYSCISPVVIFPSLLESASPSMPFIRKKLKMPCFSSGDELDTWSLEDAVITVKLDGKALASALSAMGFTLARRTSPERL